MRLTVAACRPCRCDPRRAGRGGNDLRLQREGQQHLHPRRRDAGGDRDRAGRPAAARHHPQPRQQACSSSAPATTNQVEVMDTTTYEIVAHACRPVPIPSCSCSSPSGNPLYIANEDDNMVTVVDVEAGERVSPKFRSAWSRRAWASAPTARWLVNTSETTNMAHFIDTDDPRDHRQCAGGLPAALRRVHAPTARRSGCRPRSAARSASSISQRARSSRPSASKSPGVTKEAIQPVGVRVTKDGKLAFVALGPANRVAVIDAADLRGEGLSARRPAGLAACLQSPTNRASSRPTGSATTSP